MSTAPRPDLAGVRVRKRKKDNKAKFEPEEFCKDLIEEIKEAGDNFELISKKLDSASEDLDYKRYGEVLFDVLFTGGMLDAGGMNTLEEKSPVYLFNSKPTPDDIKRHVEIFNLLIRRFRYLQQIFEDSVKKMMRFINRFDPESNTKLAMACVYFFVSQLAPMSALTVLHMDHLAKEGHSLEFVTTVFKTYLTENQMDILTANMRKYALEENLLEFFPPNKRSNDVLARHFNAEGLPQIVELYNKRMISKTKEDIEESTKRMMKDGTQFADVSSYLKQQKQKGEISDNEFIDIIWDSMMQSIEWSRRAEQAEDQLIKQVNEWGNLLLDIVYGPKLEMALLLKIQNFCYEDQRFSKIFWRILAHLYQMEIICEAAILYWHTKGASQKGKAQFMKQMEPFIKWLSEAQEESGDD